MRAAAGHAALRRASTRPPPPPPPPRRRLLLALLLSLLAAPATVLPAAGELPAPEQLQPQPKAPPQPQPLPPHLQQLPPAVPGAVHTVFLTDCSPYSDWQALAMAFGWRDSGQSGRLTRVMCCTEEERAAYPGDKLSLVPTHVAPSFSRHAPSGDEYAAYNKPGGVIHWLAHAPPDEEWVLVLDSDMILRRAFDPADYAARLGPSEARGARYDYLIGVDNDLAERHIPEVPRAEDARAGPRGRRADRVGGFYFIRRDDLARVAPLWLKYAQDVRGDPEAWHLSGDFYAAKPGDRPWISEMYGYAFGAAKAGLSHQSDEESMIYPGYVPQGVPRILHYGLLWHLEYEGGRWSFDKHWFHLFDINACPPWDLTVSRPLQGLFPPPPLPSQLLKNVTRLQRYTDLISIEVVHTLNAALCQHHIARCPPSDELLSVCSEAAAAYEATRAAVRAMDAMMACADADELHCADWARLGECERNPDFMRVNCKVSCRLCTPHNATAAPLPPSALAKALARLTPQTQAGSAAAVGAQPGALQQPEPPPSPPVVEARHPQPKRDQQQPGQQQLGQQQPEQQQPGQGQQQQQHQQEQEKQQEGSRGQRAPADSASGNAIPALISRCYGRGGLTVQQVRECIAAARRGVDWRGPDGAAAASAAAARTGAARAAAARAAAAAVDPGTASTGTAELAAAAGAAAAAGKGAGTVAAGTGAAATVAADGGTATREAAAAAAAVAKAAGSGSGAAAVEGGAPDEEDEDEDKGGDEEGGEEEEEEEAGEEQPAEAEDAEQGGAPEGGAKGWPVEPEEAAEEAEAARQADYSDHPASGTTAAALVAAAAAHGTRMGSLGALIAWFGVVGMFLSLLPRLFQRSRRRESAPLDAVAAKSHV
ncbi:hypothetical protein Rsub_03761 [Raphidocelis subcapitata]|uniref:ShKT domain-containing protein n=1 Tax=Raphidocelis subcapitata TaxID=307507 RepID=A0A2V0NTF0_9CHLO|nr:hypothetical protein Rsub_03761 [Raphidocelis subcapitata]|eukprot:GBF90906.1 hypothetical protein Rsub_03761 [Raphidocelis subcapitata]